MTTGGPAAGILLYVYIAKKLYEYTTIAFVCVGLVWLFVGNSAVGFNISGALFVLAFLVVVPARSATICGLYCAFCFPDERLEAIKLYATMKKAMP